MTEFVLSSIFLEMKLLFSLFLFFKKEKKGKGLTSVLNHAIMGDDRGASNKSIRYEKATPGVVWEKGFVAEGCLGRAGSPGIADNIRRAVAEMRSAIFVPFTIIPAWGVI